MTLLKQKKLGRYTLLDRIAEGGSAEVFRGLEDRGHGIQRLVAVKVIHWELADETSFLELFREETKLSLGLNHPNIVQTFDFGEDEDGRPFIVFEYVHGRTLRSLLDRLTDREARIPVDLSIFIAEQAAKALQYAHTFEEPLTGRVLNIVHRDLSPHNLMISYDGVPKLIDFGIAKIVQEKDRTQTGFIKGKPAYLSPEQVAGDPLDGRSDIFALGVVLWETLTGGKLFAGGTPLAIMERISSKSFEIEPPSKFNPNVPAELDQITLKALARKPNERHQTAGELQGQLYKQISRKNRDAYFGELSTLLAGLFATEIGQERAAIRRVSEEVEEITGSQLTVSWLVPHPRPFANAEPTRSDIVTALREVQELPPVDSSAVIELETRSEILLAEDKEEPEEELRAPEPVAKESVVREPVAKEPVAKEPVAKEPVVKEPVVKAPATQPEKPVQQVAPAKPKPATGRQRGTMTVPDRYVPPRTIFQAALPAQNEFTERYGSSRPSLFKMTLLGLGFSTIVAGAAFVLTRPQEEKQLIPAEPVASPAPAAAAAPVPRKPARTKKPVKPRHKRVFR